MRMEHITQDDLGIEGNPFITRFKTKVISNLRIILSILGIEGNPFITRFKTN